VYTDVNYKTKKALKADVKAGKPVTYFQPGGMFPAPTDGRIVVEGPQYPKPHRWYAECIAKNGLIVSVK
jgi:hypothetical protein